MSRNPFLVDVLIFSAAFALLGAAAAAGVSAGVGVAASSTDAEEALWHTSSAACFGATARLRDLVPEPPVADSPAVVPVKAEPAAAVDRKNVVTLEDPLLEAAGLRSETPPVLAFEGTSQASVAAFLGEPGASAATLGGTHGDVGLHHFVQLTGQVVEVFDKSGRSLAGPLPLAALWSDLSQESGCHGPGSDAAVAYDPGADRWILSRTVPGGHFCLAVSETSDPTAAYFVYDFVLREDGGLVDTRLAVWPDGYYVSADGPGPGLPRVTVAVLERQRILAGDPVARIVRRDLVSSAPREDSEPGKEQAKAEVFAALQPVHWQGWTAPLEGTPGLFLMTWDDEIRSTGDDSDGYRLWELAVDWSASPPRAAWTPLGQVESPEIDSELCGFGPCVPQIGKGELLESVSQRTMDRVVYRNFGDHEALLVNHTVDAGTNRAGIRWAELRRTDRGEGWQLFQTGTYAPDDRRHRWLGSVAMDSFGNVALSYVVSSDSELPSVRYATRSPEDPAGLLSGETECFTSHEVQTDSAHLWGEITVLGVDPADDCTFWLTDKYYDVDGSAGFKTRVCAFRLPECGCVPGEPGHERSCADGVDNDCDGTFDFADLACLTKAGGPDLEVLDVRVVGPINAGQPVSVSFDVINNGPGDAAAHHDSVYFSRDQVLDSFDWNVRDVLRGVVTEAGTTYTVDTTAPAPFVAGDYYVLVETDHPDYLAEEDETNNVLAAGPFTLHLPDLEVLDVRVVEPINAGQPVSVSFDVINNGPGDASLHFDSVFFSRDDVVDSGDEKAVSVWRDVVTPAGTTYTVDTTGRAPFSIGTYYLLVETYSSGYATEDDKTNNVFAFGPITLHGPDFEVLDVRAVEPINAGQPVSVSFDVINNGPGDATTTIDYLYFSRDDLLDSGDVYARYVVHGDVTAAGATYTINTTVQAPFSSGTYYLLVQTDSTGRVAEEDETNNLNAFGPFTLHLPDLEVVDVRVVEPINTGQPVSVSFDVINNGPGDAAANYYDRVSYSHDDVLGSGDVTVGSMVRGTVVAAGTTYTVNTTVPAPFLDRTDDDRTYYLLVKADHYDRVAEEDETNNVLAFGPFTLHLPDLEVADVRVVEPINAGQPVSVSFDVINHGPGDAAANYYDHVYYSRDDVLGQGDWLASSVKHGVVTPAGTTYTLNTTAPAPFSIGTYYLLVATDTRFSFDVDLAEEDETNNVFAFGPVTLNGPDLEVVDVRVVGPIDEGQPLSVSFDVINHGPGDAVAHVDSVYFSHDPVLGSDDVRVRHISRPIVTAAGTAYSVSTAPWPPSWSEPYYLLVKTDGGDNVAEENENNNVFAVGPISNRPPTADAGGPYSVPEGGSVVLTGSASDPDGDALTYAWAFDEDGVFDDGTDHSVSFSAALLDGPGTRTVAFQVRDGVNPPVVASTPVTVTNEIPTVGAISAPATVEINTLFTLSAPFTDPGVADTHTADWSWGNSVASAGTVDESGGSGTAEGSYAYPDPGVYTITLTVTDDDFGSGQATFSITVTAPPVAVAAVAPAGNGVKPVEVTHTVTLHTLVCGILEDGQPVLEDLGGGATGQLTYFAGRQYSAHCVFTHTDLGEGPAQSFLRFQAVRGSNQTLHQETYDLAAGSPQERTFAIDDELASLDYPPNQRVYVFDGTGSYDPDGGSIVEYQWSVFAADGTRTDLTGAVVSFTFQNGDHTVRLVVIDDEGQTSDPVDIPVSI